MIPDIFLLFVLVGAVFGKPGGRGVLFHPQHTEGAAEARSGAVSDVSGAREDHFESQIARKILDSQETAESLPYIRDAKDCCIDNKHCDVLTRDGKIDTR